MSGTYSSNSACPLRQLITKICLLGQIKQEKQHTYIVNNKVIKMTTFDKIRLEITSVFEKASTNQ